MLQSWNALGYLEAMLLDHNALSGFLPGSWGNLGELQVLSLGEPPPWRDGNHPLTLCLQGFPLFVTLFKTGPDQLLGARCRLDAINLSCSVHGLDTQTWHWLLSLICAGCVLLPVGHLLSLVAGATALAGPIPLSWINMTSLQVLDVGDACGICGNMPMFPQMSIGRSQVESSGSSLGWIYTRGQCGGGFSISIVAQAGAWRPLSLFCRSCFSAASGMRCFEYLGTVAAMTSLSRSLIRAGQILDVLDTGLLLAVICVSIVCGLIVLCLLRRLLQHYYPNALLIYPLAPRMERRRLGN